MEEQLTKARSTTLKLHDELFKGREYGNMTMLDWIGKGNFLGIAKWDVGKISSTMRDVMIAKAIDILYGLQRVYIFGGQPCDEPAGLGYAPKGGTVCYKNKMYSIYWWAPDRDAADKINPVNFERRWGWVTNPPGMMSLGKKGGPYEDIPWRVSRLVFHSHAKHQCVDGDPTQNIIASSVDAWESAGRRNRYDIALAQRRLQETFRDPKDGIYQKGTAWEGVFTVPVS